MRCFCYICATMKRSRNELLRRYLSFVVVLFVIAFGTSLSIRANLGSSPISCPPYVLSLIPGAPLTMGGFTMCMHVFFITAQILMLRRDFQKIQLLQIVVSVIFGVYTDITMWLTSFLQVPVDLSPALRYPLCLTELLCGGAILAYGISMEVHCDVLMLAGEGFPLAISKVTHGDFGKVKMCSDTGLVCVGIAIMFAVFGQWHWDMIGPGTLISMFYVGFMVRVFSPRLGWLDRMLCDKTASDVAEPTTDVAQQPVVITISREYGSGGHAVGEALAKRLGIAFYDHDIIDRVASSLGYSREYVASKEQNISTAKLWELVFTDKSIPESMNPSHDDAIFVAESRTIRELAAKSSCVIIGRMANWVLRDRGNCVRVFVTSSRQRAIDEVTSQRHISPDEASREIERINKGRSNHYLQYSGHHWHDVRGYDIVVNTSTISIDYAVEIIAQIAQGNTSNLK